MSALPTRRRSVWPFRCAALLLVLLASSALPTPSPHGGPQPFSPLPNDGAGAPASFSLGTPTNLTLASQPLGLSSQFWGTTISAEAHLLPDETALLNATRSHVLVWPGANAGDRLNMLNGSMLTVNGTSLTWAPPATNETQFIHLCRELSCEAILQVPGEIDNPSLAAQVVNYTERTLGFTPAYWEIGNEPELWVQWQRPWSQWNLPPETGSQRIAPPQYAWQVHNYTAVLRTADPNIRILGLAGTGRSQNKFPLSDWVNDTVAVNAATLGGIAFHVYTAGVWGNGTLAQFYAFDTGPYSVPGRVSDARSAISAEVNATCPGCPDPPVILTELGSALSHYQFGNLSQGFAGGLSLAASEIEGMDLNVSNLDVFASVLNTSNSWFALDGARRPDATVYTDLLSHLGSQVFPASLQAANSPTNSGSNTSLNANLYAVATVEPTDQGRADLLLVNQNISTNVSFAPTLPGIGPGIPAELWTWSGAPHFSSSNSSWWVRATTPAPQATFFPNGLPASWTLPPQAIALFESYPTAATEVTFNSTGVPASTAWFVTVDGRSLSSTVPTLSALLPQGTYPVGAPSLSLPAGTLYPNPHERLEPFPPAPLVVGSTPVLAIVPYVDQWSVAWAAFPSGMGVVVPNVAWANASVPTTLTAVPIQGWVPSSWVGKGAGSYTGSGPQAIITPRSSIHENVTFVPGFNANFAETGLPPGSNWSVRVDLVSQWSTTSTISFVEPNGSYIFQVSSVAGYTASPSSSSFAISGAALQVGVQFTPNPTTYAVSWQETGLPGNTSWSVLVDGTPSSSAGPALTVALANGTHTFTVPSPPGYQPTPRGGTLVVAGTPMQLAVTFSPFALPVSFNASGLPAGQVWSITLGGVSVSTSDPQYLVTEPNGTYAWSVVAPTGYTANPSSGTLWVHGGAVFVTVTFVSGGSSSAPGGFGSSLFWTLLVVGLVAAVAIVLVLVLSHRRGSGPGRRGEEEWRTPPRETSPGLPPPRGPS